MIAKFEKLGTFKSVVEALHEVVQDVTLMCGPNGITMQAMDSSHVCMVEILLNDFKEYKCDSETSLSLSLPSLLKVLKCGDANKHALELSDNGDRLRVLMTRENNDIEVSLKLMEIDNDMLTVPETAYGTVLMVPSTDFKKVVTDCQALGDTVSFTVVENEKTFKVGVKGDVGDISIELPNSAPSENESVEQAFAVRYLLYFTKASALSDKVRISLDGAMPMRVEYRFGDKSHVCYYLAPKMNDD